MQNILIIGAGDAGRIIAHSLSGKKQTRIIGFLDDNPGLHHKIISNICVLGPVRLLSDLAKKQVISEVIVAIPSASGELLTPIIKEILNANLSYRIAPGFYNYNTRDVDIRYPLRKIDITDLLGRHTVDLPISLVSDYLSNKRVLITGAGGSIGSEIARTVAMFHPKQIQLLGRGEGSIFSIQNELFMRFHSISLLPLIVNCTDRSSLMTYFKKLKPDIIFHTAAHKHVPYMELNPREAFINNVTGSLNVFDAAVTSGVKNVVILSTDKAVKPKCVMGISKRVVECLIQNDYQDTGPVFSGVRFGNVLGSRGSVVEVFQKQIESGEPLTVTHKNATRYFMTIPEAAQLVIMAGALAEQGHMYVLDMGKQIPIVKLAKDLIELNGLTPQKDIEIIFTRLRRGEKMKESLLVSPEFKKTIHNKIWDDPPPEKRHPIKSRINALLPKLDAMTGPQILKFMKELITSGKG
ncbi:MAG: polysaccharide biosynthesis protein [Candidatus Aureabacteria bacterium]|nr:polysaccharide biosynthesis protein [Candidatus Auribacterota bacterium]